MALRLSSTYNTTIVIDGEVIPIKIARLNPQQAIDFNRDFARMGRANDSAKAPVPEGELGDARQAREQRAEEDERSAKTFVVEAISQYVAIEPGHIVEDDSPESITKGADLVRLFGARDAMLSELLMIIFMENKLDAEQKANWRTRLAPFVPTPVAVADRMMAIAKVTDTDTVVDLGCGSGRLCIAAAQRGATAIGYDIDADRIAEANEAARAAGVTDRCTFIQQDALTADLRSATVVSLYLLAGANAKLRPVLLSQLPAGARVVSHAFAMGGNWIADVSELVPLGEGEQLDHTGQRWVYLYSVDRWRKAHQG
ncbi:MAG TPA: class I SAM-dependent methyltransferase [Vicinamibacterales bacterium]|nr:class I SAM-dependent methyltransferase [Vicinamibacterales bacterium]